MALERTEERTGGGFLVPRACRGACAESTNEVLIRFVKTDAFFYVGPIKYPIEIDLFWSLVRSTLLTTAVLPFLLKDFGTRRKLLNKVILSLFFFFFCFLFLKNGLDHLPFLLL